MVKVVQPAKRLRGDVVVPADKSITHRSVFLSALARGISTIKNPLAAEDCLSSLKCVEKLGCHVEKKKDSWMVEGVGLWGFSPPSHPLDCGNSGTTMRILSGLLAAQDFESTLIGDPSLSKRPMDRVAEPLKSMGASFTLSQGKFAPVTIKGQKPMRAISWESKVASAQVKSAVLLAGLHADGETSFEEPGLSRDHTERMLLAAGASLQKSGLKSVVKGPCELKSADWVVPGDFSSAAFFIAAGLLIEGGEVILRSVNLNPTRTGFLSYLKDMGASWDIKNQKDLGGEPVGDLVIKGRANLRAVSLKPHLVPSLIDEIPIMAVLATQARGKTVFSNLSELRVKETDRLKAMALNLSALGAKIEETQDGLIIEGPSILGGGMVNSFLDHRIAMAMSVAGLISKSDVSIQGSESVMISFPSFWTQLSSLTGNI